MSDGPCSRKLMDLFPLVEFRRCVERYRGNHKVGIEASLSRILQILSVIVFEKTPILQVLEGLDSQLPPLHPSNQLTRFDL